MVKIIEPKIETAELKSDGTYGRFVVEPLDRGFGTTLGLSLIHISRREARQLVGHGHFTVNGQRVDVPSYQVKPGDVVAVCEKSRNSTKFKTLVEELGKNPTPKWIEKEAGSFEAKIAAMPARDDIDYEVNEQLIVELYSK